MDISVYGWSASPNSALAEACAACSIELHAARVLTANRGRYQLAAACGTIDATLAGAFHECDAGQWPVTGDWVAYEPAAARIRAVLPRKTLVARKRAGTASRPQALAANVDALLIVMGLDQDFNPRRLERYLLLAAESGATPVVVLNKSDLCADLMERLNAVRPLTRGEVVVLSALDPASVVQLHRVFERGQTAALVGSSGAGKSTLANALLGVERQAIGSVREADHRGRHTTTTRELVLLPAGWMLIDTPGLRELEVWGGDAALDVAFDVAFDEIAALAAQCRFADCRHREEPGCAVREALHAGSLDAGRLDNFLKLRRETDAQQAKRRARMASRAQNQLYRGGLRMKD
jgi:ribosome biogenesis GTPase